MTSPSRREVLAGGAGLAAWLSGCRARAGDTRHITGRLVEDHATAGHLLRDGGAPRGPGEARRAQVAIIGGGVAGLSAAWRLLREGVEDVIVLELGDAPGGTSSGGEVAGLRCPWGAHYLPLPRKDQRALTAFLVEAGLGRVEARSPRLVVPDEALVRAPQERLYHLGYWQESLLLQDAGDAVREAYSRFEDKLWELGWDAEQAPPFQLPLEHSSRRQVPLDTRSAADWCAELIDDCEPLRWYLEYCSRDDFGARLEETSAWALAHYHLARVDAEGNAPDYLTWPEGNGRLVDALAQPLGERLRTGTLCARVEQDGAGVTAQCVDTQTGVPFTLRADQLILATPQFVNARVLAEDPAREARRAFRYSPWVVANVHLSEAPASRGFPLAWDNVLFGSDSLGYVDGTHQLDRLDDPSRLWSWYLPITDPDERGARQRLFGTTWEHWRDALLADLAPAHVGLTERVTHIDVRRWGHAMIKPVPGFLWGGAREAAAKSIGRVHFAHTDLSGMALFEEAHWWGTLAAENTMLALGVDFASLA